MAGPVATTERPARDEARTFTTRLILVSATCIAVPLLTATVTGSIGIPHNDDWAFLRILFDFADTGTVDLVGWNEMTLIGHLAVAWPVVKIFGPNIAALNVFVALVSGAGLVMLGLIARRFLPPFYALVTVVLVGVFPGFALVTATFMTDNTAFTAQMACVLLGLMAYESQRGERDTLLAAALVAGIFAFSIREFAILAPIGVVAGYGVANRRDGRSILRAVVALGALLACAYLLYRWRREFPGDTPHFFSSNFSLNMLPFLSQVLFTFSLGVAPALVFAARGRTLAPALWAPFAIAATALGIFTIQHTDNSPTCCLRGEGSVFVGNLLTERGALGNQALFGDRPSLFPEGMWLVMSGAALLAAAFLVAMGIKRLVQFRSGSIGTDPGATSLAVFGAATAGAIVFRHALGGPLFDRYVTMLVAVGAIFLLRAAPAPRGGWRELGGGLVSVGALVVVAIIAIGSAASFDSARWKSGEAAVAAGVPAQDVDAGFEWVGFHYRGGVNEPGERRSAPTPPGYMDMFPAAGNCNIVATSPQDDPDFDLIRVSSYRQWLVGRTQFVYLYRFRRGCRASSP